MSISNRRRLVIAWSAAAAALTVAAAIVAVTIVDGGSLTAARSTSSATPPSSTTAPTTTAPTSTAASPPPSAQPPATSTPAPPRPPDDKPGPVILVPGYGGDAAMLDGLASRLRQAGRAVVTLTLPDGATGDLRGQEQVLAAEIDRQLKKGAASVDLVGYSAGGIVVALFVEAEPSRVRRVVTLGSPLHGTRLAGLAAGLLPSACPTACEQMVPGSPLLASLGAASPARTGVPWLSMWTSNDSVVTPPDSARFDGAENVELQSICADDAATHITLPDDPLAQGLTLRALDTAGLPLPSAAPADCAALRAAAS